MAFLHNLFRPISPAFLPRTSTTTSAPGVVYTLARSLGSTSVLSLVSGTHSNLTLSGLDLVATSSIGSGITQTAVVRESRSDGIAVEYPVYLTGNGVGAPSASVTNTLSDSNLPGNQVSGFIARADTIDSYLTARGV